MTVPAAERPAERHPFPPIDPDRNQLILVVGRKGSGKSVFAREVFRAWPGVDKLVIDPTGDADPGADIITHHYTGRQLPRELPTVPRGKFAVVRWVADPSAPTYTDDLDRAVQLVLFPKHRRTLLWVDEAGEVFPANRTGPYARTLLHQGRHWQASAVIAGPRPMNLDPLVLAQADRVVMYDVPHPRDRERIAQAIGWPPRELNFELDQTRAAGPHWFLMYDAREHMLYRCPPLPIARQGPPRRRGGDMLGAVGAQA